ncbi:MAG TPA: DMT family transporter [Candidatus Krumholzibacteriaceae bacterium]|nr:DMT family transporter [Candidatus Krumholzibacteriaceae bacterium]
MPYNSSKGQLPLPVVRSLLVLLFVFWSNSFTAIMHLRELFAPSGLLLARFFPVSLICSAYLASSRERRRITLEILKKFPVRIIAMGGFGIAGYNIFLYLGQSEIKPGAAALITTLSPLFTMIFSVILLKVKVPLKRIIGVIIAFAGLYCVVMWGGIGLGNVTDISNAEITYALITGLAPISWSLYTIIGKSLTKHYTPSIISSLSLVIGTIPFILAADGNFFSAVAEMNSTHWLALSHLSILCTIAGYWIWNTGLKYLPATSVASFIYLNPPMAAIFGWFLYGEEITLFFIAGSAVILTGLWLAQKNSN